MARPKPALLKKLGITDSNRVIARGTFLPGALLDELSVLRPDVLSGMLHGRGEYDVILVGRKTYDPLGADLDELGRRLAPGGQLWVVFSRVISMKYPLNERLVREIAASVGLNLGPLIPLRGRWVAAEHRAMAKNLSDRRFDDPLPE